MQLRMRELVQEALSVHANVASNIQYQIAVVDVGEPLLGGKGELFALSCASLRLA